MVDVVFGGRVVAGPEVVGEVEGARSVPRFRGGVVDDDVVEDDAGGRWLAARPPRR
jgi:hypothetical protein